MKTETQREREKQSLEKFISLNDNISNSAKEKFNPFQSMVLDNWKNKEIFFLVNLAIFFSKLRK